MTTERVVPFRARDEFEANLINVLGSKRPEKGPGLLVHGAGVRANILPNCGQSGRAIAEEARAAGDRRPLCCCSQKNTARGRVCYARLQSASKNLRTG
jgi:hypothetical protein